MWTIGRSQRVEEKKYRPIVRKLRYLVVLFVSDTPQEKQQYTFAYSQQTLGESVALQRRNGIDRIKTSVNRSDLKKNIYMYLSKESVHEWLSLWTKYHMTTRLTLCYTVHFVLFLLNTIWTSVHLNLQRTNGSILKIILERTNTDKSKRSAVLTKLTVLLKC